MIDRPRRYHVGDLVRLKKGHPCGENCWEITRTGIDFGLKCRGCGRRVMVPRRKFESAVREVLRPAGPEESGDGAPA